MLSVVCIPGASGSIAAIAPGGIVLIVKRDPSRRRGPR
jgi:hypothetical protein